MSCFYIRKSLEKNKVKLFYKNICGIIDIKDNIIEIPIKEKTIKHNENINKIKRIVNNLKENNVRLAVLSINLEKQVKLLNEMYASDIEIIDGTYLFKVLSRKIIEYICKELKISIQNLEVAILVNDASSTNKNIITNIAEAVKSLSVITNNVNDFRDIEDELYNQKGIVINISNNRKKGLLKSKIILNIDFCQEDINLFNIPRDCVIININTSIKIKTKKFNGININSYKIIMPNEYKMIGFSDEKIYESLIYNLDYSKAIKQVLKDGIIIKNLIGENGIIQSEEFNKLF